MAPKKLLKFSPGRIILFSLLGAIIVGTILLALPFSRTVPLAWIDLFFISTSVITVTGLLPVPLTSFTPFGQFIILLLMQVGGLGLITMTIFVLSLFIELGFSTQILAGQLLELESWKNIKKLLVFIIKLSAAVELLGTGLIFLAIRHDYSLIKGLFLSCFHAIAAFCDAGFSLFPGGMIFYRTNIPMLLITSFLMIIGGLGFITWREIINYFQTFIYKKKPHFSLHTKIVLSMTATIILSTTILFWILERNNSLAPLNPYFTFFNAIFNAISVRSTGFLTVQPLELQVATIFLIMIVSFIGSSPGSTGSGIKTTNFAIFLATIKTAISGNLSVEIKGRRIAKDQVYKALAIIALSIGWILGCIFCLLITEKHLSFLDIVFEVVAAFATLGISTGITASLSIIGKLFIIASMIIGRIGSLTVILALRKRPETREFEYPEERVLLG